MEYKVIYTATVTELEANVNVFINEGWELQGGVCRDSQLLYQALVKFPMPSGREGMFGVEWGPINEKASEYVKSIGEKLKEGAEDALDAAQDILDRENNKFRDYYAKQEIRLKYSKLADEEINRRFKK
jgi:hypothetical protein